MTDFESYIRQGEPGQRERANNWSIAIGLQAVDGLTPSEYLINSARENIEGHISLDEVRQRINAYYQSKEGRELEAKEAGKEEADKVSENITRLLSEQTFALNVASFANLHRRIFAGVMKHAGEFRKYNISKKEWVLDGATVLYGSASELRATLEYDFSEEKKFSYKNLDMDEIIHHLAVFVSRLWQIHIFGEGNTRTTAVFFIKYLRTLGFDSTNDIFAENAWYFRNSLVRANYNDLKKGIHETTEYLELFLRNLLLDEKNELHNRSMHISGDLVQSASDNNSKCKSCTLEEVMIIKAIMENPNITQKELAIILGKSERIVKTRTVEMQRKELIARENGKRNGRWIVLINTKEI